LLDLRGPTSKAREGSDGRGGEGTGRERKGREGTGGKGIAPFLKS